MSIIAQVAGSGTPATTVTPMPDLLSPKLGTERSINMSKKLLITNSGVFWPRGVIDGSARQL
jgi:hypothetical protein